MDELVRLVQHGREERNLEYKCTLNWSNSSVKAKITKSIMAMSNIPDGGTVLVGMRKQGELYEAEGMADEDADSFKQDDVSTHVNTFADPYVEITVRHFAHEGKRFVAIEVREFSEIPVVCKKNGTDLRAGAVYTRSRRKHETIEVPSQVEMREIVERAVDKGIRKQYQRMQMAGVAPAAVGPADAQLFADQLKDIQ